VPLNALCTSLVIVSLLSLINLGSSVAFNAIMSLGTASLLSSYMASTGCVRWKRWHGEKLPPARWTLGKWSSTVETGALLSLLIIFVFCFFPLTTDPTAESMNWTVVIFGSVFLLSLLYYMLHARKVYRGPVAKVMTFQ
jgi:choline transport protein